MMRDTQTALLSWRVTQKEDVQHAPELLKGDLQLQVGDPLTCEHMTRAEHSFYIFECGSGWKREGKKSECYLEIFHIGSCNA